MKFCSTCENMYYIQISDDDQADTLSYYCRKCGNKDNVDENESICISSYDNNTNVGISNSINRFTKYDPTLPRHYNIKCPNDNCLTNEAKDGDEHIKSAEVLYVRYNETDMKYIYMCTTCDTSWRSDIDKH
jgi:DNA-directed RNA polymerase subunit M/transcription elongation factor TFIIS